MTDAIARHKAGIEKEIEEEIEQFGIEMRLYHKTVEEATKCKYCIEKQKKLKAKLKEARQDEKTS